MITLYGSNPIFGLPEASPYVMKTEIHLRMAGIPYRKVAAMPAERRPTRPAFQEVVTVAAEAPVIERLVAWTGRDPRWAAA